MFTGFTDETVDFMWGIRFNNERSWFESHKEIYLTQFYRPMCDLAEELYGFMLEKRPDCGLIRKVTRIYRDARRLHGRGPYKESLWFSVEQPSEQWTARPTFWFELRLAGQAEFALETEDYKRPKSAAPSPALEPWFRARSFTIVHQDKLTEDLFNREIVGRLKRGWEFLLPYYDYFITLDGDPDPPPKEVPS